MQETSPIIKIKGLGPKSAAVYEKAGIRTVGDLIRYYPRTYDEMKDPVELSTLSVRDDGAVVAVEGHVEAALSVRYLKNFRIVTGKIRSHGESLDVTWFNMPFMRSQVHPGTTYIFRGQIKAKGRSFYLLQPKVYDLCDYALLQKNLQPVYPLTAGLSEHSLRKALRQVLLGEDPLDFSMDPLPEWIRVRYSLPPVRETIRAIHFPQSKDQLQDTRHRLVFEEFFNFILLLKQLRERRTAQTHSYVIPKTLKTAAAIRSLPYQLTASQEKVWEEISEELSQKKVMARLVQGDVGCGKTIIAFLALVQTAAAGMQGAIMAPTEVLARQHYDGFVKLVQQAGLPIRAVLLTGSLKAREKREACGLIENGEAQVVIGTHALIQESVRFRNLALVVTDEQHRFGVGQREMLSGKAEEMPHAIVMSATPIPRTLAVILYGDLDISVISERPSERLPVKNAVVDPSYRPKAYAFIASQVKEGHQAYVICPMVGESGSGEIEAENVIDYTDTLREALARYLPDIRVEYLHGRMKNEEKNAVMQRFLDGEIKVLVSTTVVEVGVNVPNATVMMIENCERFGLAQLHQLRGRVGRGKDQSYCILMHHSESDAVKKRLQILKESNDGFEIARKDLELRGPGELFGLRQSGELSFLLADVYQDAGIMQEASEAAGKILAQDPELEREENRLIRRELQRQAEAGKAHMTL